VVRVLLLVPNTVRTVLMPGIRQWGQLGLTEFGGDRPFKYADALINGASPNDGFAVYVNVIASRTHLTSSCRYSNETAVYEIFEVAAKVQKFRSLLD
jgi:mannan endo-1,4-beta-mannosidase